MGTQRACFFFGLMAMVMMVMMVMVNVTTPTTTTRRGGKPPICTSLGLRSTIFVPGPLWSFAIRRRGSPDLSLIRSGFTVC